MAGKGLCGHAVCASYGMARVRTTPCVEGGSERKGGCAGVEFSARLETNADLTILGKAMHRVHGQQAGVRLRPLAELCYQ